MSKKKTCDKCRGTGHDKNSRPKVKFVPEQQDDGTWKRKHKTVKQGSGCLWCCGLGYTE